MFSSGLEGETVRAMYSAGLKLLLLYDLKRVLVCCTLVRTPRGLGEEIPFQSYSLSCICLSGVSFKQMFVVVS